MLEQRIQQQFFDSADLQYAAAELLAKPIAEAVSALVGCITAGGKVLACGHGASVRHAQHLAALLVGRYERDRPGLAALALSDEASAVAGLAGEAESDAVYAKQVQAFGSPGDVLLVLTLGGDAAPLVQAVEAAHAKDMTVIALTGHGGGALRSLLAETDVHLGVPHERAARVHETHLLALHCICDAVDLQLLGEQDTA